MSFDVELIVRKKRRSGRAGNTVNAKAVTCTEVQAETFPDTFGDSLMAEKDRRLALIICEWIYFPRNALRMTFKFERYDLPV
jgi:hypothetical protein